MAVSYILKPLTDIYSQPEKHIFMSNHNYPAQQQTFTI